MSISIPQDKGCVYPELHWYVRFLPPLNSHAWIQIGCSSFLPFPFHNFHCLLVSLVLVLSSFSLSTLLLNSLLLHFGSFNYENCLLRSLTTKTPQSIPFISVETDKRGYRCDTDQLN